MQKSTVLIGVMLFLVGSLSGYAFSQRLNSESTASEHTHDHSHSSDDHTKDQAHMHELLNVPATNAPSVEVSAMSDAKSGWNITLTTERFSFTPQNVNQDHVLGEGHAHLYINDKKVARLYGANFHYNADLAAGDVIKVTLNTNDHKEYAVDDQVIASMFIIK